MNLLALKTEVENHGFDDTVWGSRIVTYLNDGYNLICRRVDYYVDEAVDDVTTTANQTLIPFPADFGRLRSVRDTDRDMELQSVLLRQLDRSSSTLTGAPFAYALQSSNVRIYPKTDGVYHLELRYWKMPAALSADGDTPILPTDWHRLLWQWAVKECFASDDDPQMSQYWEQQFNATLAEFAADVKFANSDAPTQASSMWSSGEGLTQRGWSLYPWG